MQNYTAIIATNDDAATCKLSCVEKGYYKDKFVGFFVKDPVKRPPLINRGYFSRVAALKTILSQFLESSKSYSKRQIVVLGAGFDTTYFQMAEQMSSETLPTFYELDLDDVVKRKAAVILKYNLLNTTQADVNKTGLQFGKYHLLSVDLNALEQVKTVLFDAGIDCKAPTLFLSECVMIYMKPEMSDSLISWVAHNFDLATFATYEQIKPHDAFGAVMVQNLEKRGCPLLVINAYPTLESQKQRYLNLGWDRVEGMTMYDIYNQVLDKNEVKRIQSIEFLDEFEEWKLLQEHYAILWAFRDKENTNIFSNLGFRTQ